MSLTVAGNWKMFASRKQVGAFVEELAKLWTLGNGPIDGVRSLIFPPAGYLSLLATELEAQLPGSIELGGQNCHSAEEGAFTGEMAPGMLVDLGARWVLAGHSERRSLFGETDAVIAAKVGAALAAGLSPILCVGETLEQRDAGEAEGCVTGQVQVVLDALGAESFAKVTLAYEPVWAIGTGRSASPEQAQDMHGVLRHQLAQASAELAGQVEILYGGSVKPANAAELFAQPDIDGALVGGASLAAESFWQLIDAARVQDAQA